MEEQKNTKEANSSRRFWVLTTLGMASVLMIGLLSYSLYSILYSHLLESTKDSLNKEVQLASQDVQKEFASLRDDLNYYVDKLASPESAGDQGRIIKLLSDYRSLIDTIYFTQGDQQFFFLLDDNDNLLGDVYTEEVQGHSSNHLTVQSSAHNQQLIASLDFRGFFTDYTSTYLHTGRKLYYEDGRLSPLDSGISHTDIAYSTSLMDLLRVDINKGLRGSYEEQLPVRSGDAENQQEALIVQYPFQLNPMPQSFAFLFVQEKQGLLSNLYNTYLYLFLALFGVLLFVLFLMLKFFENTYNNKLLLEKKSKDINLLFNQQTMLLQQSNGFVYYHDKYGKVYKASENIKDVLGHTPQEFAEKVKQLIPQEDLVRIQALVRDALENKKEYIYYEIDIAKSDGSLIRTKNFEKFFFDDNNNFSGSIGICTDIHEKYLADQELIKSENRLRAVLNSLPDTIYIYDNEGIFLDYYVQREDLLIGPAKDTLGRNISDIFPYPLNEKVGASFNKTLTTGKMQTQEIDMIIKGGKKYYEIRFFKLDDRRVISLARDITDQKLWGDGLKEAKEAAESANKHKSEFLANMSHEIRTPMNGLLGMISLLGTTELTPQQKQYVSIIQDSGECLLSIVNDILDYSKIEAGKLELKLASFHLRNELERLMDIFTGMVIGKNIQISLSISENIPEQVVLDKEKLKQILFNIVGNAIKFTPSGGAIYLIVSGEVIISNNLMLYFSIRDTGKGIPSAYVHKLTQPFIQVDSSDTREHTGTGLGLAIASKLIELMGGYLQIESEEGSGSEFAFTIMAHAAETDLITHRETEPRDEPMDFRGFSEHFPAKILLVEDNEINRKFMSIVFTQMGYQPDIAKNGQEAIDMVLQKSYDIIFMDHQMPKMNGAEATKAIRGLENGPAIKIIGLSANVLDKDADNQYREGKDGHLAKPVKIEDIAETIRSCFESMGN